MRVAGTYSRGGLKLVTVADGHRAAWDSGITEEEARDILAGNKVTLSDVRGTGQWLDARDKLRAAFQREPAS